MSDFTLVRLAAIASIEGKLPSVEKYMEYMKEVNATAANNRRLDHRRRATFKCGSECRVNLHSLGHSSTLGSHRGLKSLGNSGGGKERTQEEYPELYDEAGFDS